MHVAKIVCLSNRPMRDYSLVFLTVSMTDHWCCTECLPLEPTHKMLLDLVALISQLHWQSMLYRASALRTFLCEVKGDSKKSSGPNDRNGVRKEKKNSVYLLSIMLKIDVWKARKHGRECFHFVWGSRRSMYVTSWTRLAYVTKMYVTSWASHFGLLKW